VASSGGKWDGGRARLLSDLDGPTLATLVSRVTESMCGIGFRAAPAKSVLPERWWRIAVLPIGGARPLEVILLSDEKSCRALALGMFGKGLTLEEGLVEDAFRELLNMAAGQIKSVLVPDQALGLPRIVREEELPADRRRLLFEGLLLQSSGKECLFIAVLGLTPGTA
jgi:hypothetical protein